MDVPPCCSARRSRAAPAGTCRCRPRPGRTGSLSDAEWAEVAEEAMSRLGFEASGHQAACRWVAVRHGRSSAGNDHVHVVVNLVREDGRVARTANDFRQLSRLCADMEAATGSVPSRGGPTKRPCPGSPGPRRRRPAAPDGHETERAELARVVRAAATVAGSEAEFVRLLRDAGLAARPRYDRVGGHRVVGYAVAEEPSDGGVAVFFGGGKLARDLSLPALRDRWRDGEAESQEAAAEWAGGAPATGVREAPRAGRHLTFRWAEASERWGKPALREEHRVPTRWSPARWREATEGLGEVVRELGAVPAEDVTTWRAVASDAAGVLAVLSGRLERVPGPLAHASGLLARSAQGPRQRPTKVRCVPRGTIKSVAALMAQADLDEDHAGRLEASLGRDAPGGPGGARCPLGALGISAGWPSGRRGPEGAGQRQGAARLAASAPRRAPRGSRACPRGSRARAGGGGEASAPTGGQRSAAARAVRRDDNGAGTPETVLGSGEVSVAGAVHGRAAGRRYRRDVAVVPAHV